MAGTILITGASSGLGAEMARQLAAKGHDLGLCARRTDRLEALHDELARLHPGRRVEVRALDVNDHDRVFEVFGELRGALGRLDRVVVNAGVGNGARLGTGGFDANRRVAETNFVAALAQVEAAMEIFRDQDAGHLVVISSVSALRGLPGAAATYAATKAGLAHLAEGLRVELLGTPIKVTVLYPGFIESEMTSPRSPRWLVTSTVDGVRSMVEAIEGEKPSARVPAWPWQPLGLLIRHVPRSLARKLL